MRTGRMYRVLGISLTAAMLAGSFPAAAMAEENAGPQLDESRKTTYYRA